jgi:hypothetical protein
MTPSETKDGQAARDETSTWLDASHGPHRAMKLRVIAVVGFAVLSLAFMLGLDALGCLLWQCEVDDAAERAVGALGLLMATGHVLVSLLLVWPLTLTLRQRFGNVLAPLLAASACALLIAVLMHDPDFDRSMVRTVMFVGTMLGAPWFAAGVLSCALWPKSFPPQSGPPAD